MRTTPAISPLARPRRLTRLYIVALSVVALMLLAGQGLIQWQLARQAHDSHIVNVAGRQRMLSQRLAKDALRLARADEANDRRAVAELLRETLELWQRSHSELGASRDNSAEVNALFAAVDKPYQTMRQSATKLLAVPADPSRRGEIDAQVQTILQHEPEFLAGMDQIVSQYDAEATARVKRLRNIELALLLATLAVLAVEGLYLFRPAVRRLSETLLALRLTARQLAQAKQAAEQASRAKSDFLAHMSHELRTPMNAILGLTDLALDSPLNDQQRQYLSVAKESAESLLHLLNDALDLAKIEAGRLELDLRPFEVRPLFARVVDAFAPQALAKGVPLHCIVTDETPAWLNSDPERIRQIVANLVSNAIKFTEAGRISVHVSCEPRDVDGVTLKFVVRDTGIGIPADRLAAIFEAFTQADASTTRRFGGTGLGLTIVEQLVRRLGGTVSVESREGHGSAFHIALPCDRAVAPTDAPAEVAAPVRFDRPLQILVAEDTSANQLVMRGILERHGHRVTIAPTGAAVLEELRRGRFDVLLLDVEMPELDGFQTISALRAAEGEQATARRLPVVAVTAWATVDHRERCLAAGMDAYLTKPIQAAVLLQTIATVVAGVYAEHSAEPAAATSEAAAIYNRQLALERLEGNQTLWGQLIRLFADEEPKMMATLAAAVADRKGDAIAVGAHRIKGFVSNFAAAKTMAIAAELEQAALDARFELVDTGWPALQSAVAELRVALLSEVECPSAAE